jgi:YD repeat-containing protein
MAPLVDLKGSGVVISQFDYRYDNTANRVGVTEASGDRVTWTYDATYQLTRERRSGVNSYDVTHVYDPAGNRTLKLDGGSRTTSAYNGANQIVWSQDGSGRTTITYDADGNLTREVKPSGQITTSVWDAENMNSAVLLPDTTRVTYTYNADHLRVRVSGRSKPASDGRLKTGHFERGKSRRRFSSTFYLLTETDHGEPTRNGECSSDTPAPCAAMVTAPHCPAPGP